MKKSGQVSMFVLLGLMLVSVVAIVYYVIQGNSQANLEKEFGSDAVVKADISSLQSSISYCMDQKSREALKRIGIQGGFYNKPTYYSDLGWTFIPYYYNGGQLLMPSKEKVESELSADVDDNLPECIDSLNIKSFQVSGKEPKTTTTISKGQVKFVVDMPLDVKRGDKATTIELRNQPVYINSSLFDILEVANYLTSTHSQDSAMFCVNCLVDMAKERNLYVDMLEYEQGTTLVTITENYTSYQPYLFEFLNKY